MIPALYLRPNSKQVSALSGFTRQQQQSTKDKTDNRQKVGFLSLPTPRIVEGSGRFIDFKSVTMSSSEDEKLFTKRLRDATKSIHDVSDHMVNLKLGVAMSDDSVWAEGLLVFYEVFRFLEGAVQRTKDSLLGEYNLIAGLWRTKVNTLSILYKR